MSEAYAFLVYLKKRFESLEIQLKDLLKEEEILKKDILVKKGWLIRRYSLNLNKINKNVVQELKEKSESISALEQDILYKGKAVEKNLKQVEKEYLAYEKEKIDLSNLLQRYMNDAFYLSKIMAGRLHELERLLDEGVKLGRKNVGVKVGRVIDGLERIATRILRFIDLVNQLEKKLKDFQEANYLPKERMFGRAMTKKEAKNTVTKKELIGSPKRGEGDLIGVFDCGASTFRKISSMSQDQLKNFFGQIGVVGAIKVVFFTTNLRPRAGPVRQSNGLGEYKFPKGIPIEIAVA